MDVLFHGMAAVAWFLASCSSPGWRDAEHQRWQQQKYKYNVRMFWSSALPMWLFPCFVFTVIQKYAQDKEKPVLQMLMKLSDMSDMTLVVCLTRLSRKSSMSTWPPSTEQSKYTDFEAAAHTQLQSCHADSSTESWPQNAGSAFDTGVVGWVGWVWVGAGWPDSEM